MACSLVPLPGSPSVSTNPTEIFPTGPSDFSAAGGASITIFVDSDSGTVHLTAATLNGNSIPLDANEKAAFTCSDPTNFLDMAFVGSDPTELFRIKEDCGTGTSQVLRTWRLLAEVPGGPTTTLRIHIS